MTTPNPKGSLDGSTVTLTGTQVHRAAQLVEDQLHEVVDGLLQTLEAGLCQGSPEASDKTLEDAIKRLTSLRAKLLRLNYGEERGPVEFTVDALFPAEATR